MSDDNHGSVCLAAIVSWFNEDNTCQVIIGLKVQQVLEEIKGLMNNVNTIEKNKIKHGENISKFFALSKSDINKENFDIEKNVNIEKREFEYVVKLKNGMHARPAGKIVSLVKENSAKVNIEANGKSASGDSITSIMALGVVNGTNVKVLVESKNVEMVSQKIKKYLSEEE